jgi:phage shock protein A
MLLRRLKAIFEAKANRALDQMEDPREMLDLSYEKQVEMLRDVKRGVVDVAGAKRRLEVQAGQLRQKAENLEQQARQALAGGREDLARAALEARHVTVAELQNLEAQIQNLAADERRLIQTEQQLSARVEAFRTRKEVMKAQYSAAQATVRVGEAISGISEDMADLGISIQRAEDRIAQMNARGTAINDLLAAGVLDDPLDTRSSLEREIADVSKAGAVELELEALKRELAAPAAPPLLGPGERSQA